VRLFLVQTINYFHVVLICSVSLGAVSNCNASQQQKEKPNNTDVTVNEFKHPEPSSSVHAWWPWRGGMITKDGITKDLESMKRQNIAHADIFNTSGGDFGLERIKFNTGEWYEMFQWALHETSRLGITIGVHNCDGWSSSGGPWITPDKSMKRFVFTKTMVKESDNETIILPKPNCETDFYRDVAVVAYRTNTGVSSFQNSNPRFSLNGQEIGTVLHDGSPVSMLEIKKGDAIDITFPKEFTTDKLAIFPSYKMHPIGVFKCLLTIMASADGQSYKKIKEIEISELNKSKFIEFPKLKSKYFRIGIDDISNLSSWMQLTLSEVELLRDTEKPAYFPGTPYLREKSASVGVGDIKIFDEIVEPLAPQDIIPQGSIIDITEKMDEDGKLNWDIPGGSWSIIRFGYTTTGATTQPSTIEGKGLECDKMDTSALNFHFNNFPQKLINYAGTYTGATFTNLLIDSWEAGFQDWTNAMPREFEQRRGYSIIDWIPVFCGELIESREKSEGFLYDFRKTVAELIEENYYGHFSELCKRNGLKLEAEAIYGYECTPRPPVDVLKANSYLDTPMSEFWTSEDGQNFVKYDRYDGIVVKFPIYSSVLYNKQIIGAESYSSDAQYSESPSDLKIFGDRAFCAGINRITLHSFVHQPFDKKPGISHGPHGTHFSRHNPWWEYAKGWMDYQARVQAVLQKGQMYSDIIYYIGEQFPASLRNKTTDDLPAGYNAIPCNYDALPGINVSRGKLKLNNHEFSVLILPDKRGIGYGTLLKIVDLIRNGAVVYGAKPDRLLSLAEDKDKENFQKLADKIWAGFGGDNTRNKYGKGVVIWGEPILQVLAELKLVPDLTTDIPAPVNIAEKGKKRLYGFNRNTGPLELMYIHKTTATKDIFFVVNQTEDLIRKDYLFGVAGSIPEIWDPVSGEVTMPAVYSEEGGQIRIPVELQPKESRFFIFRKGNPDVQINKVYFNGSQIFPNKGGGVAIPQVKYGQGGFVFTAQQGGKYTFTTNTGSNYTLELGGTKTYEIKDFEGRIEFSPIYVEKIGPVKISEFKSLTNFEDGAVKYFAGVAKYSVDFDVAPGFYTGKDSVVLSLGEFDAIAEVSLNGRYLGNIWHPVIRIPVKLLRDNGNHMEVTVPTMCRNRIIGDLRTYGQVKTIWVPSEAISRLDKEKLLKPTGITGPVRLINYQNKTINQYKYEK
jgi:hypothetical protein